MLVGDARTAAADWVAAHAAGRDGFRGAFHTGSTLALPDDMELPATSDIDLLVVVDGSPPAKPGKFRHRGALLEVGHVPWQELRITEEVAGCYYLAPSFTADHAIADPTGRLAELRAAIGPRFAEPASITRRCADVRARVKARLGVLDGSGSWAEQVLRWLFPASLATQLPLVAALRLPTVRKRYPAARAVLQAHGSAPLYESMLEALGCGQLDPATAQHHLDRLATVFDRAAALASTRFAFCGDITADARAVAVDGSQQLVDAGDHREAVFWIVATLARCQRILDADGRAADRAATEAGFRAAVADLTGVRTRADLLHRRDETLALLPAVVDAAAAIIDRPAQPS